MVLPGEAFGFGLICGSQSTVERFERVGGMGWFNEDAVGVEAGLRVAVRGERRNRPAGLVRPVAGAALGALDQAVLALPECRGVSLGEAGQVGVLRAIDERGFVCGRMGS